MCSTFITFSHKTDVRLLLIYHYEYERYELNIVDIHQQTISLSHCYTILTSFIKNLHKFRTIYFVGESSC